MVHLVFFTYSSVCESATSIFLQRISMLSMGSSKQLEICFLTYIIVFFEFVYFNDFGSLLSCKYQSSHAKGISLNSKSAISCFLIYLESSKLGYLTDLVSRSLNSGINQSTILYIVRSLTTDSRGFPPRSASQDGHFE